MHGHSSSDLLGAGFNLGTHATLHSQAAHRHLSACSFRPVLHLARTCKDVKDNAGPAAVSGLRKWRDKSQTPAVPLEVGLEEADFSLNDLRYNRSALVSHLSAIAHIIVAGQWQH